MKGSDGREVEAPREPPPTRVEANELGGEAKLVLGKEEDGEEAAGGRKAKAGKKQKQKGGNQVLMRWG